jgi:signal transduction histidine kinase
VTRRVLLGYLGIALFVLVALEVPLGVQNQRNERHDVEVKVERDATVLSSYAEDAVQTGNRRQLADVARFAYSYARAAGTRVVIVDQRGYALVDTSARVAGTESFASRPEFARALKGNVAVGTRRSDTLHANLLYVAVPVGSGGTVSGAVRITYPTSSVDARILRSWLLLGGIAAVVLAVAAILGLTIARFVTRPLLGLERAAAEFGAGELGARAPERDGPPEVQSLAAVFNDTASKLEQLVNSQKDFVADASHELRTPLTAIRLRLETLVAGVDGEERRNAQAALRELDRLSELVDRMLTLARADAGAEPAGRVDVAAIARERVEAWQPVAEEHDVTLVAVANGPAAARAGSARLVQVIDNLLSNALAHCPAGTTVKVSTEVSPAWVSLRVRDHGPGMSAEQRARAFDRFWRAGTGPTGSGLGLAIVRRLVESDGGSVELTAAAGGGTEAVVRLPASSSVRRPDDQGRAVRLVRDTLRH